MSSANSKRQSIPKMDTKVEVPTIDNPKPSIWTRIKTAAKKTANVIAKPFKAIAAKFKSAPKTESESKPTVAYAKYMAYRAKYAAKRTAKSVSGFLGKLWYRALKPLCQLVLISTLVTVLFISAFLAPWATVLTLVAAAMASFGLARILQALENAEATSKGARLTLRTFEVVARLGRALLYTGALAMLVAMCAASASFAFFITTFVVLSYLEVKHAMNIAFYSWCVLTGNWGTLIVFVLLDLTIFNTSSHTKMATATDTAAVPAHSVTRLPREEHADVRMRPVTETVIDAEIIVDSVVAKVVTPDDAPGRPHLWTRGNFLRAKGTEELWGTAHDVAPESAPNWADQWDASARCIACTEPKGSLRVTVEGPVDTHGLCSTCFDLQCEEDALRFTGVSLKARSIQFQLNATGIAATAEYSASKFSNTTLHWLPTAWWRDRAGKAFEREWSCLHDGNVVSTVRHNFKRNVYLVTVLGKTVSSTKTTLGAAKRLASDTINDEGNAVSRMVETLGDLADSVGEKLVPPLLFPSTKKG